jgi:hypothetical protein
MGGACCTNGRLYRIAVGKYGRKRSLGRTMSRRKNNIAIYLKGVG